MHKKLIDQAKEQDLKELAIYMFDEIKQMPKVYQEAEDKLYELIYGHHFNEWSLKKALESLQNEDGTKGPHWTYDQTSDVARQYGINSNLYDWCYVLNMIYSDFYGTVANDSNTYVKLAKKFIEDKDAKDGKVYRYYKAIRKEEA